MDRVIMMKMDTERHLPSALQLRILSFLPSNDRALSGRLVSPDAAAGLSEPQHCTVSLSQPLPPHATPWVVEAGHQHARQLSFWCKLQLMSTAAATGSEVNLEVALALLQPSIFPELIQEERNAYYKRKLKSWVDRFLLCDPGVAAVKAGHLQLLPWLLRRCPGLLWPERVLEAAVRYCDLAGLREALGLLNAQGSGMRSDRSSNSGGCCCCGGRCLCSTDAGGALGQRLLDGAAEAETPDAVQKVSEIMDTYQCRVAEDTAMAAVRSGDLVRLRWLREREGWDTRVAGARVLHCALAQSTLEVVQWLVEQGGCVLPAEEGASPSAWEDRGWDWGPFMASAAMSTDGLAKLQWLRERRASHSDRDEDLFWIVRAALNAGQVDVARHALLCLGPRLEALTWDTPRLFTELGCCAAASGSVPMVELMRQAGATFSSEAYMRAAQAASLPMVRWLVDEVKVSARGLDLSNFMLQWGEKPGVLEAVQLLVRAGAEVAAGAEVTLQARNARDALHVAAHVASPGLVQYLLQLYPGARPGGKEVAAAAHSGYGAVLDLLVPVASGLEAPICFTARLSPYILAGQKGDRATLAALRRLGVPWGTGDAVVQAVREGCKAPVLRWLVEQGAPMGGSRGEVDLAATHALERGVLSAEETAWLRSVGGGGGSDGAPSGTSM